MVGATLDTATEQHRIALAAAVLLHDDGFRAFGQRRAGEDLQRFAAAGGAVQRMAGGDTSGYRQTGFAIGGEVVVKDRIAVDRRVVVGRHVAIRSDGFGEDASEGGGERNGLDRGDRGQPFGQKVERLRQRHQLVTGDETVVTGFGHGSPPEGGNGR